LLPTLPQKIKSLWLWTFAVKLVLAAVLPLSLDESYYWVWSHNLQLSYFDHPPLVSWLYLLGQPLEFLGQAVRWPGVILGHLTVYIWLVIVKPHCSETTLKWFLLLLLTTPLLGLGSLIITPDVPLMFFWSLSTLIFIKTLEQPRFQKFLLLGALLGLGFLSKYHVALFLPMALMVMMLAKELNIKNLPGLLVGALIFFTVAAPVIYWNYTNDWVSFSFQLNHGLGGESWKPRWTLSYLLGQILIFFPTVLFVATKKFRQRLQGSVLDKTLIVFGFVPLLFFLYSSTKAHVEANWPIIAVPFVIALATINSGNKTRWARSAVWFWSGFSLIVLSDVFLRWIPGNPGSIKSQEFYYYENIVKYVQENPEEPFYARTFQMASKVTYDSGVLVPKILGSSRFDFYDMHEMSQPKEEVIYLFVRSGENIPSGATVNPYKITDRKSIDSSFDVLELTHQ